VITLSDLERADGIRWLDLRHAELRSAKSLGILNRICGGELTQRMARDLATPRRFPAAGTYEPAGVRMTAAFLVRHFQRGRDGPMASVLKPVQLLVGEGWLLSAWLSPRLFRGDPEALEVDSDGDPERLFAATADRWPESGCETAVELAKLIRRELEVESGHRSRAH
jgi:hypothetical protein